MRAHAGKYAHAAAYASRGLCVHAKGVIRTGFGYGYRQFHVSANRQAVRELDPMADIDIDIRAALESTFVRTPSLPPC